jgi:hypothetical protein
LALLRPAYLFASSSARSLCLGLFRNSFGSMGRAGFGEPTRSRAMAFSSLLALNFLRFMANQGTTPEAGLTVVRKHLYNGLSAS